MAEPFVPVPLEVAARSDLLPSAKLLFGVILSKSMLAGYCWASNAFLGKQIAVQVKHVTDLIGDLQDVDLLRVVIYKDQGNRRFLWPEPKYLLGERADPDARTAFLNPWNADPTPLQRDTYPSTEGEVPTSRGIPSRPVGGDPIPLQAHQLEESITSSEKKIEETIDQKEGAAPDFSFNSFSEKAEDERTEEERAEKEAAAQRAAQAAEAKMQTAREVIANLKAREQRSARLEALKAKWPELPIEERKPFLVTAEQELEASGVMNPPARIVQSRAINLYAAQSAQDLSVTTDHQQEKTNDCSN